MIQIKKSAILKNLENFKKISQIVFVVQNFQLIMCKFFPKKCLEGLLLFTLIWLDKHFLLLSNMHIK